MGEKSDSVKLTIFDLGDWSKPATALVERCADAIGGAFTPFQIKRVANAEAQAEEIRARTQIKIEKIHRRAADRFIAEETRKQINMENIIRGAVPALGDTARPADIESDWIANFFDKCRLVSDEQMQTIWSRILAGEAKNPGCFSKRTVNLVGSLEKFEAELFSTFCRYVFVSQDGLQQTPLILQYQDTIYRQNNLTFGTLNHLADIGLIQFSALGHIANQRGPCERFLYCGQPLEVRFAEGHPRTLTLGQAMLTVSGMQLSHLAAVEPVAGFVEYVAEFWKRYGVTLTPPKST
jgi:hypothetical protein